MDLAHEGDADLADEYALTLDLDAEVLPAPLDRQIDGAASSEVLAGGLEVHWLLVQVAHDRGVGEDRVVTRQVTWTQWAHQQTLGAKGEGQLHQDILSPAPRPA